MTGRHADNRAEQPLRTVHEIKPGSFIFEQPNSLSERFCKEVIQHFEDTKDEQHEGRVGQLADKNSSIKKSTDLVVSGKAHWKNADQTLFHALAWQSGNFVRGILFSKAHSRIWATASKEPVQVSIITGMSTAAAMTSVTVSWWRYGT